MAGPRPHSERVDGASIVGGIVGRPGNRKERREVNICSWLTSSSPISPKAQEEEVAQGYGICHTSPGAQGGTPSLPVLHHQTQGSPICRGPAGQSTCLIPFYSELLTPCLGLDPSLCC